ncbi:FK506-binding protein, partial [Lachnellula occidentalis]
SPTSTLSPSYRTRNFSGTTAAMGVTKTVLSEGSGPAPKVGDTVTIEYTGFIKDTNKPGNKGSQFDSSVGRGAFVVKIGVGKVIQGWDEGVTTMKVGEKATLDITPDYGYGDRYVYNSRVPFSTCTQSVLPPHPVGFPGAIPPNSSLIFDVELQKIE